MNSLTVTRPQRAARIALAAAYALALAACGGDGGADPAAAVAQAAFEVGDIYIVESTMEGGATSSRSYLVHGVSIKGELLATASADLVPDALVPLPMADASTAKFVNPANFKPISPEALRQTYQALVQAKAQHDGALNIQAAIEEIADLDGDLVSIHADLQRSGLTPTQYLAFYDTLDQVPAFAAQEDAELQAMNFFDAIEDYELQGAACGSITRGDPCNRLPNCSSNNLGPWCGASPAAAAAWLESLAALGTDFKGLATTMSARRHDFNALTGVYRAWRSSHPEAVMPKDFIAAYLAGSAKIAADAQARSTSSPGSIDQVGDLPCDAGRAFTFIDKNMVQSGIANSAACFTDMAWQAAHIPFADGDTLVGPGMHFRLEKSGKKGSVVLGEMRAYWRATYHVSAPRSPAQRWLGFTPLVKINVTELSTADKVQLAAYASTEIDSMAAGIALTVNVKPTDRSLKNAPAIAPQTQRLSFRQGFL